jgi:antitoxin ParD1/3/4
MPTRNISLTRQQDAYVAELVERGTYQNASEALRDALRALQQRRQEDALRLKALRAEIAAGEAALDAGDFDEVDVREIGKYLRSLRPAVPKRSRKRR